ncbi:MAG: hypothetical protein E3J72_15325 [Planctomycetota bacterium]|nr:MAG: hypothetical protein E3J72_15325 [Planctomycetota bacterium]
MFTNRIDCCIVLLFLVFLSLSCATRTRIAANPDNSARAQRAVGKPASIRKKPAELPGKEFVYPFVEEDCHILGRIQCLEIRRYEKGDAIYIDHVKDGAVIWQEIDDCKNGSIDVVNYYDQAHTRFCSYRGCMIVCCFIPENKIAREKAIYKAAFAAKKEGNLKESKRLFELLCWEILWCPVDLGLDEYVEKAKKALDDYTRKIETPVSKKEK